LGEARRKADARGKGHRCMGIHLSAGGLAKVAAY